MVDLHLSLRWEGRGLTYALPIFLYEKVGLHRVWSCVAHPFVVGVRTSYGDSRLPYLLLHIFIAVVNFGSHKNSKD